MNATEALQAAREAGVGVRVDGQDLLLNAPAQPPSALLEVLAQHKADIIALLEAGEAQWTVEEWRARFDERAAIAEFDGGLSRHDAEALAHACCVVEWLNHNPATSAPGYCAQCEQRERSHNPLVPFSHGTAGYTWLHHRCWSPWQARRRADARAALAAMGIVDRSDRT